MVRAFAVIVAVLIGTGSAAFAVDHATSNASPRTPTELGCADTPPLPPIETCAPLDTQARVDPTQVMPVNEVSRVSMALIGIAADRTGRNAASRIS